VICQFCKKNVATVHLTELVEGKKQEIHLCEQCARKKGLSLKKQLSLQDLLTSLMEQKKENIPEALLSIKCPVCGLTFREFRESGRLGCPQDYQVFKEGLKLLLERIHGSSKHVGKVPTRIDSDTAKKRALLDLRSQLEEAIHREEYERAAELRDRIRTLEGENAAAAKSGQPKAARGGAAKSQGATRSPKNKSGTKKPRKEDKNGTG
jgi:protein arginine kinase activator